MRRPPSKLNNPPPVEISKRCVDDMGGGDAAPIKAQAEFDKGGEAEAKGARVFTHGAAGQPR